MPTIGKIKVDLTGDTRRFQRSMRGARGQVVAFGRALSRMAGPLTALTGVFGFGLLIKSTTEEALRLKQLADRLGANIERFSQLSRVLGRSGIQMNQTGVALQRLRRRTAEASQGNEGLIATFDTLGLNIDDLMAMDPVDAFLAVAEALTRVDNSAERLRLAFKLLDTEGVQVLQADLANLRREMEQTPGITAEQAAAVTEAAEAWTKLKEALSSLFLLVESKLGIFEKMTEAAEAARDFIDKPPSGKEIAEKWAAAILTGNGVVIDRIARALGFEPGDALSPSDEGPPAIVAPRRGIIGGGKMLVSPPAETEGSLLPTGVTDSGSLEFRSRNQGMVLNVLRQIRDNTAQPPVAVAQ